MTSQIKRGLHFSYHSQGSLMVLQQIALYKCLTCDSVDTGTYHHLCNDNTHWQVCVLHLYMHYVKQNALTYKYRQFSTDAKTQTENMLTLFFHFLCEILWLKRVPTYKWLQMSGILCHISSCTPPSGVKTPVSVHSLVSSLANTILQSWTEHWR